ncbi:hypothetical protein NJI34_00225 [Pseudomonas sp. S 311-6]|uniref:hypothetical protein n=1 Tax=Pseudomonas TaxID=286 RepID=UPI002097FB72|nr:MULTISPECIES: hypothetical protein [Pseudomonas]MCO7563552.1 hypothetical protein [Pseudomonas mosselii]MCO7616253.1 hypothetical protein [Pseudomonas guariconensis]MCO7635208.1 hypothetical protein [Pseudomonas sp. S 311-6]
MKPGFETPINGTAARVIARGESFEYRPLESEVCSSTPLPIKLASADLQDLTGTKFGRLTVVGYSADKSRRWVCRCSCGNYVLRRTKAVEQAAPDSACPQCYLLAVSKRQEFIRRTGKERHTREFM